MKLFDEPVGSFRNPVQTLTLSSQNPSLRGQNMSFVEHMQLLEKAVLHACTTGEKFCQMENLTILAVLMVLIVGLIATICLFTFIREDREEHITPLCPQLIVKQPHLTFRLPLDSPAETFEVTDIDNSLVCKVAMDMADPGRMGVTGVAGTIRLQSSSGVTLATVVARNVDFAGQGLALCRAGCDIFGFVEPDGDHQYHIRHRTGVHLLTFAGDFRAGHIEGLNPVNVKVCQIRRMTGIYAGHVLQHVDAGLVLCGLLSIHVHQCLMMKESPFSLKTPRAMKGCTSVGSPQTRPLMIRPPQQKRQAMPLAAGANANIGPRQAEDNRSVEDIPETQAFTPILRPLTQWPPSTGEVSAACGLGPPCTFNRPSDTFEPASEPGGASAACDLGPPCTFNRPSDTYEPASEPVGHSDTQ